MDRRVGERREPAGQSCTRILIFCRHILDCRSSLSEAPTLGGAWLDFSLKCGEECDVRIGIKDWRRRGMAYPGRLVGAYRALITSGTASSQGGTPVYSRAPMHRRNLLCFAHALPVEGPAPMLRRGQHGTSPVSTMAGRRSVPAAMAGRVDRV